MRNLPQAADLLAVARETLITELKPLLDEQGRYTLAMIANAMAIARREAEAGEEPAQAALERLDALTGRARRELHGHPLHEALHTYSRQLAADIRAGRYDADDARRRALLEHLRESVAAKLRVSNPKSLEP